jgi:superfamily II DNA or RNA helicase
MSKIKIEKLNEVYLKITADADVRRELSDYFSFEVPGYKFTPQYRNRVWDGKIRLYSYATGQMYVGLVEYLIDWCKKNNVEYDIPDKLLVKPNTFSKADLVQLLEQFKLPIEPRDYQMDAMGYAMDRQRALLLSPTASGKSLIAYMFVKYWLMKAEDINGADVIPNDKKILIIVPTTSLVEQLYKDFKSYGCDVENIITRKYHGYEIDETKPVLISTWQSLYKLPKEFFAQFGAVIGDEAHLFKAVSLTKIMTKLVDCPWRIGMTGTLEDSKTHKLVLQGLFGPVKQVAQTRKLIEKKQLADLKIYCLVMRYLDGTAKKMSGVKYHEELEYLVTDESRNKYIRNLACGLQGNTLLLFQLVEKHGKGLYELIKNKVGADRKVFFVYGGTDTKQREKIREITEQSDNAIIVASYGTFSTGINIRNLHNIIFASPSKSRIRNLQSIGRSLRIGENKAKATLYDIADDMTYNGKKNYTLSHFQQRINIYNEEGFSYEIHTVDLKS